ncbi:YihY/virulence factor BrkB family protein [Neoehrlichia mikurensis]|uniref:YihY/virulence factor BrkB family protein n=1 Tax=Neoehrlichia mikurensis TaxID=89586 RepID=A0A9Q9F3S6_9RICK|nr:YihY/virulence factor BrkB family protein [Neoehrlichia mikurensis]QXK91924.1 YihY/virulence factor BrkB family protein [Neoehrlichia mikurensis]QXK93137.1 YihY/virulence factor BrkB family protein [Neoehrlichia mikurensis]QXK93617.1 YihY/virulence factor BrkB family protein [Neoehrlichia mikurensis]UTO55427.1 YihY/virulence factor BrkB family protein [Neoehrlichia mikurensis]UTO56347.1 YihY/virulence factor BrkB family protein [Neoehrlichia mikurensis]
MIHKKIKFFIKCIYLALNDFIDHDGIEHAGYLSFIILLSIFPFLVFLTAVVSNFAVILDQYNFTEKFFMLIIDNVPQNLIAGLIPRINEIVLGPPHSLLTLAAVGTVWTASSAVEGVRTILNKALRVSTPPPYILRRLLSILQFLIITFIITITMMCIILVPMIFDLLNQHWGYVKYTVSGLVLLISITCLYSIIPNTRQNIINVIPGAIVVTLLWTISSFLFAWYIKNFHSLSIIYGSLAGIIVSLLFFYILSIFFIYGAELNYRLNQYKK